MRYAGPSRVTYPANEPPTQAIHAGVKAGAVPAALGFFGPDSESPCSLGGSGLLRIAICGKSCLRGAYRSKGGGLKLPFRGFEGCDCRKGLGERARAISACNLGIKPDIIGVPPTTRMADAIVFRRSTGTWTRPLKLA